MKTLLITRSNRAIGQKLNMTCHNYFENIIIKIDLS